MSSAIAKMLRFGTGRMVCLIPSQVRMLRQIPSASTGSPRPIVGSQPSEMENTMINMSPTRKLGRLMLPHAISCGSTSTDHRTLRADGRASRSEIHSGRNR